MNHNLGEFCFIRRSGGTVLLCSGYQYILKKKYKNGGKVWECNKRKKSKCYGRAIEIENELFARTDHTCTPDYGKNEIDKIMYNYKKTILASKALRLRAATAAKSPAAADK